MKNFIDIPDRHLQKFMAQNAAATLEFLLTEKEKGFVELANQVHDCGIDLSPFPNLEKFFKNKKTV